MSDKENWFASLDVGNESRLMRAFSRMSPDEQRSFIEMAEAKAGTVEDYMKNCVGRGIRGTDGRPPSGGPRAGRRPQAERRSQAGR